LAPAIFFHLFLKKVLTALWYVIIILVDVSNNANAKRTEDRMENANYQPALRTIKENADKITVEISLVESTGNRLFEDYVATHYLAKITEGYRVETETPSRMSNENWVTVRSFEIFGKGHTPEEALDALRQQRDCIAHTTYAIAAKRMKLVRNY